MYLERVPFLSVIIPAHNEEKTICKTIHSLLMQDYSPFEIVIVDDGSTDDTDKRIIDHFGLCKMIITQSSRQVEYKQILGIWSVICNNVNLYLIAKENGGKGDALNAGIGFCHGDFCACIDADCVFSIDTLSYLSKKFRNNVHMAAVGGRVLPVYGICDYIPQAGCRFLNVLQSYQELEYGIAFSIVRPAFDAIGATMLISGALGLFRKDVIIALGGYALDTVGEDMELVMRIRRYAIENNKSMNIGYTKESVCFTELPWKISDLIKQRIRWTVGLSDVLWKYRSMATKKEYHIFERITFWYYLLFEKFSPHLELLGFIICLFFQISKCAIVLIVTIIFFQLLLTFAGSFQSIKNSIRMSNNKCRAIIKLLFLMLSFVTVYHAAHSIVRLISVPYYKMKNLKLKNRGVVWNSPTRMRSE